MRVGWDEDIELHGEDLGLEGVVVMGGLGEQVGVGNQQCAVVGGGFLGLGAWL